MFEKCFFENKWSKNRINKKKIILSTGIIIILILVVIFGPIRVETLGSRHEPL